MRKTALALALAWGLEPLPASAQRLDSLRERIEALVSPTDAEVGVYVRDLVTGDSLGLRADLRFHAASTMKVAVMVQVFRDIDAGLLRLDGRERVVNRFRSIADSSVYSLSPADDSDSSLYGRVGQDVPVVRLVELMIQVSSNLATNVLVERVGAARVQVTLHELGAESLLVLRGVEDGAAFRAGLNNTTTARALGALLAAIADGRAATAASCGRMLRILAGQRFRDGIPAGLPRGTRVAHKTGEITALHHDAGVVYVAGRPRYVLVVLTRGLRDRARSAALIADVASVVHQSLTGARP